MPYMRLRTWIAPDARGPDLGKRKRQRPTDMLARDAQAVAEGAAQLRVGRLCVQQHGRVRVTRDQRRALTRQGAGSVECKAANYGVQECGLDVPESRAHA